MNSSTISACLIVDDFPLNASYWRRAQCEAFGYEAPQVCEFSMGWPEQRKAPFIQPQVYEDFIELAERFDVRGKLTVLPYPGGMGCIADGVRYLPDADRERLIELTLGAADRFTICLETLTHTMAHDPDTGALFPHTESAWISHLAAEGQVDKLTEILSSGWEVLQRIGLECRGIVIGGMPDVSGIAGGELLYQGKYVHVLASALRRTGTAFGEEGPLAMMAMSPPPEEAGGYPFAVAHDEPENAPVYHFQPTIGDPLLGVMRGDGDVGTEAAKLVTPDLESGALIELAEAGKPINILTHAQSLNALNTGKGVAVLRLAFERLHQRYGERIRWQTPLQQAETAPGN